MPNIPAIDNGTMVESFKFLNYYHLATSSLVSKRFWNLIRTHRHKLALLHVDEIFMNSFVASDLPDVIEVFNKELSPEEYNEWIVRNGYSKQIRLKGQIAGEENTKYLRDIYLFGADVYQNSNRSHLVLFARAEFKDETLLLFQHFIRLLMDPFIYIRDLDLNPQKDVISIFVGAMSTDRDRLQCKQLNIRFNGDTQKFVVWVKDHVRCDEFIIHGNNDSNYDETLLDLFLTGDHCTSAIFVIRYDLLKVSADLVKKFMALKNGDECQLIESIRGDDVDQEVVDELKRNSTEFITQEEQSEGESGTRQVIGFINTDIKKKLTLNVGYNFYDTWPVSINVIDL